MKHLTIRNIPDDVATALDREKVRRHESLDHTVIELLRNSLGVVRGERRNGLVALAGTWTEEEHSRFEQAVAVTEQIDPELWR